MKSKMVRLGFGGHITHCVFLPKEMKLYRIQRNETQPRLRNDQIQLRIGPKAMKPGSSCNQIMQSKSLIR